MILKKITKLTITTLKEFMNGAGHEKMPEVWMLHCVSGLTF